MLQNSGTAHNCLDFRISYTVSVSGENIRNLLGMWRVHDERGALPQLRDVIGWKIHVLDSRAAKTTYRKRIASRIPTTPSTTKLIITVTLPRAPGRYDMLLHRMSALQVLDQRKRPCSQRSPGEPTEPEPPKRKLSQSPTPSPPQTHYLDTLSKIWLTREAPRELNRRTRRIKSTHQHRPESRRPLTRGFHTELRSRIQSARTSASDFLQHCTPEPLKDLKLFAKHGGPDLLDLRGVCVLKAPQIRHQGLTRCSILNLLAPLATR